LAPHQVFIEKITKYSNIKLINGFKIKFRLEIFLKLTISAQHTNYRSKNMKFRPLHDRVLIKVLDSEEKTAGGIIIPDTAKEKPQEGEVVAVGPGAKSDEGKISPMDVKIGDIVLFGKWSGTEVKIDGKEYSIMKESDIMGISKSKK
jgi:chaperonin GroES